MIADKSQDELAERTIHSPVITSYSAALDLLDWDSEDFDSDDEYDDYVSLKSKRTTGAGTNASKSRKSKGKSIGHSVSARGKISIPIRQPVLWKPLKERLLSPERPTWKDGQNVEVSLLRDWRKRFESADSISSGAPPSRKGTANSHKGKKPVSGTMDETQLTGIDGLTPWALEAESPALPPLTLNTEQISPSKSTNNVPYVNGGSSALAKKAMLRASTTIEKSNMTSKKRKASESIEEEPKPADCGEPPRVRRGRKAIKDKHDASNVSQVTEELLQVDETEIEEPAPKKGAKGRAQKGSNETKPTVTTLASTRSTRSRK